MFLEQFTIVLDQSCNGVLCTHLEAYLTLHEREVLVGYLFLEGGREGGEVGREGGRGGREGGRERERIQCLVANTYTCPMYLHVYMYKTPE